MPILIRIIAQRLIAAIVAFLAFLGLSPEATIPTDEDVRFRIEEQRRIVEQVLELKTTEITAESYNPDNIIEIIDDAANNINKRRAEVENNPTQSEINLKSSAPKPEPSPNNTAENIKDIPASQPSVTTGPIKEPEHMQPEGDMNSLADVVVNIICAQKGRGFTKASTGSGVIISPSGIILTNAHVAQLFLAEDTGGAVDCGIYRENIPTFGYRADLIYISPTWVEENKSILNDPNPRGTGEKDYALLQITENTNAVLSLPSRFSYAPILLDEGIYDEGRRISIGGFPGSPLSILDLTKSGSLQTDNSFINEIFTITGGAIDIFSTGETHVAARGASGGGIFYNNSLIGITVTVAEEGRGKKINAITTTYINNDLQEETGYTLGETINQANSVVRDNFKQNLLEDLASFVAENL